MRDRSARLNAAAWNAKQTGDEELSTMLTALAVAVDSQESMPASLTEILRWTPLIEHALRVAERRLGTDRTAPRGEVREMKQRERESAEWETATPPCLQNLDIE
jgi:hypothetical protein